MTVQCSSILVALCSTWLCVGIADGTDIPSLAAVHRKRIALVNKLGLSLQEAVRERNLDVFAQSAEILVEIQDTTHVDILLQNLDWTTNEYSPKYVSVDVPTLAFYPAADALLDLGPEISPALIRYIVRQPPRSVGFELACSIMVDSHARMYLSNVRGKSRALSELQMELAGLRETGRRSQQLRAAINRVESYVGGSYGRRHETPQFRGTSTIEGTPEGKPMNLSLGLSLPLEKKASDFQVKLSDDEQTHYEWNTRSQLPAGVRLDSNGWLSGTPRENGRFEFVAEVRSLITPGVLNRQRFVLNVPES